MTRVLVTGTDNPLGRATLEGLLARPEVEHVLAVAAEPVRGAERLDVGRFTLLPVDLARERRVHDLLFGPALELRIDTVVHTVVAPEARRRSRRRAHALGVECTRALLALAEGHPTVRSFVYRSSGDVYALQPGQPVLLTEDLPLELAPHAPQRVRERVEADLAVVTRMGLSPLRIVVLRMAEILVPGLGSQLFDYLLSRVCLRPLGFDPMLNLLTVPDAVEALIAAVTSDGRGVFNVPGADTLPLSRIVRLWGRFGVPLPGPTLVPLYLARATALGLEFRYDLDYRRFHFSAVLDGTRAREALGYRPRHRMQWPAQVEV